MFWDRKKKETGLPDLPSLPNAPALPRDRMRLPDLPENSPVPETVHQLPAFSEPLTRQGFAQAAIKDAITHSEVEEAESEIVKKEPRYTILEMEESKRATSYKPAVRSRIKEAKPLFVRLDKFQSARSTLAEIRTLMTEADELLQHIRDIKTREEQELTAWEKEMQTVRARLTNVMDEIFERAD